MPQRLSFSREICPYCVLGSAEVQTPSSTLPRCHYSSRISSFSVDSPVHVAVQDERNRDLPDVFIDWSRIHEGKPCRWHSFCCAHFFFVFTGRFHGWFCLIRRHLLRLDGGIRFLVFITRRDCRSHVRFRGRTCHKE